MSTSEQISEICEAIAREFHPEKIIVFGSHAYGTAGPFSDLDLLIVMPYEGTPLQQAARIITRVNPKIGVDVIVRTPEQIRERLALQDAFMREIIERGRVAYESQSGIYRPCSGKRKPTKIDGLRNVRDALTIKKNGRVDTRLFDDAPEYVD